MKSTLWFIVPISLAFFVGLCYGVTLGTAISYKNSEEWYHVKVIDGKHVLFEEVSKKIEIEYKKDGFVIQVYPKYIWDESWYSHGFTGGDEVVHLEKVRVKKISP
jgi:hypothetical protein